MRVCRSRISPTTRRSSSSSSARSTGESRRCTRPAAADALNYVGRVRAYRDLTEDKNLDGGVSFSWGPTDFLTGVPIAAAQTDGEEIVAPPVELGKRLVGVDLTFRYRPLRARDLPAAEPAHRTDLESSGATPGTTPVKAFGYYAMGEYQFARRWYIGGRADRSGRVLDGDAVDTGGSVFLTFWPTEFSQIRSQYRRTNYAEGVSGNEFLFQFNFSIGAHGAHVF